MTQRGETAVIPAAPEQEPILANLLELYAHDFSEFRNLDIGEDGRFGYPSLPLYWSDPDRHPFLLRVEGKWAGLVFVKKGSEVSGNFGKDAVWDIWRSSLSFADAGDVESELRRRTRCGGGSPGCGRFA